MPYSKFQERAHQSNSGVGKCLCCQTFDYTSERDQDMKFRLHHKVCCHGSVEGSKHIMVPNMMLKEIQHNNAERRKEFTSNTLVIPFQLG